MSFYLAVSLGKTVLRPLAKNLLRAAALFVSLPTEFSFDRPGGIALSSGERYPQGEILLDILRGICPTEPIAPEVTRALGELRTWLTSVLPQQVAFPELSLATLLQEVRRQSLFYSAGTPEPGFAAFWKAWESYYLIPQQFHITGRSAINPVNQSEAEDYLRAHNRAETGVRSVDNAIESLMYTIPTDVERILDIGSGPGYVNRNIPPDYSVLAMDIDEDILRGNVRQTCVGDIMDIPLADRSVDMVMACDMLEHLTEPVLQKGLSELTRVSRKYLYLQVPFQEDPLMAIAHCPRCGWVWHVNHHKRRFDQQQLMNLLPKTWKPVCVNYTGDVSTLRTGIHEEEFAQHLDWKVHGVSGAVCPNCGTRSTVQGEEELKLLHRLADFDTEFPFPTYTEIGILFCHEDQQAQLQELLCPENGPQQRRRNVLEPGECSRPLTVYTGAELLPQVYTAGCTFQATEEGYCFCRDGSVEKAWAAISFPPLQTRYTAVELIGALSEDGGTVSLAVLDGSGQECYLEDCIWSRKKAVYQLPREVQGCPTYLKLYFTAQKLTVYTARLTGGKDAPYLYYPRGDGALLTFSQEGVRYQLLYPDGEGLCLSHAPETWVQISNQAASRRERAIRRFALIMNGEICSPAGEEPDNRFFITESASAMRYVETAMAEPHQEVPETVDPRGLMLSSLFVESRLLAQIPNSNVQAPSPRKAVDRRDVLVCTLLAESVLAVYGRDAYGARYRIRMRTLSAAIRMENRVKRWLHRHKGIYQFLTRMGIKRVYVRIKRRGKR